MGLKLGGRGLRLPTALRGTVTVVAFTESGRMHRLRLSLRLLAIAVLLLLTLVTGSMASLLSVFRGQVDFARMTYLERENQSLTSLLQGQAELLSRLKLEVARLREFEQNLRVVSGMDSQTEPMVGTGQAHGGKLDAPRK
jgi:NAD(P)H-dependent FMN reductase